MSSDNPISSAPGTGPDADATVRTPSATGDMATATTRAQRDRAAQGGPSAAGPTSASLAAAGFTRNAHFSVPDLFPESPIDGHHRPTTDNDMAGQIPGAPSVSSVHMSSADADAVPAAVSSTAAPSRADWARQAAARVDATQEPGGGAAAPMPRRAADTTPENPWPVAHVAQVFSTAINRWPALWMIGQIVEINVRRQGSAYLTVHDDTEDISMQVVAFGPVAMKAREFKQGDQILLHGRANVWLKQTKFSFRADEIRAVGRGQLIEQINELRKKLKGEGLFDAERKKPLPEFPSTIGIICGPGARAESDIIRNAQLRWPTVHFVVEPAAVQGIHCPPEVIAALKKLDARDDIDVIIVARGGGSFEDLLGFSDEGVVRQIAACRHPIVTAIGHEADWTLADQAADLRASTPTDAAKRVVPDVMEQTALIADLAGRLDGKLENQLDGEQRLLDGYRTHPVLTEPERLLDEPTRVIGQALDRLDTALRLQIDDENLQLEKRLSSLEALSPLRTLERGYAIVQNRQGGVVSDAADLSEGEALTLRLRTGEAGVTVTSVGTGD